MARTNRKRAHSAGQPTISIRAERSAQSLADEHARFMRRRMVMIGVPVVLLALLAGGLLYARGGNGKPTEPARAAAPTSAIVAAAPAPSPMPTAAQPTAQPTAPVPAIAPAAAPAPVVAALTCPEIAGLPVYANAVCVKHESDQDDGVTKHDNTYTSADAADAVRRFYEGAFAQNGWTIIESKQDLEDSSWKYTIMQTPRRVKVEVDGRDPGEGTGTELSIAEK